MPLPRRKNNIDVFAGSSKELLDRRQELLDKITKSDTYLPDSVLHDDLDKGMLDYVKNNFKVVSDGSQIPIIPKILTIQRWAQTLNTFEFSDSDGNLEIPFIGVIRKPDVQLGTNPSVQRTIPDRTQFHYATVATWNGTQMGADVYRIPQPIPVDISYDVTILCTKLRELNKFNKIVMEKFSSRQSYTRVKGHYIPIILNSIEDNTPMETMDGRRFYIQNYKFTMLGFLIDSDEFEVKPAISRFFLMNEFIQGNNFAKKYKYTKTIEITVTSFVADGMQTAFSVGETIGSLFSVTVNGLKQTRDEDFYHVAYTSKITFNTAPIEGSTIIVTYYKGRNSLILDPSGRILQVSTENFVYDGSTLTYSLLNQITNIITLDINGLQEEENNGYTITGSREFTLTVPPIVGSKIGVTYLF